MSSPPAPTKLQRRKNDSAVAASLETLKTILPAIDTNEKEGDDSLSTASTPKDPSPGGLSPHEAVRVGGASNMLRLARVRLSQLRNDVAQQQQSNETLMKRVASETNVADVEKEIEGVDEQPKMTHMQRAQSWNGTGSAQKGILKGLLQGTASGSIKKDDTLPKRVRLQEEHSPPAHPPPEKAHTQEAHMEHKSSTEHSRVRFTIEDIFQANKEWAKHKRDTAPKFFENLVDVGGGGAAGAAGAAGAGGRRRTHPQLLWIGSNDTAVAPNVLLGADPRAVLVHQNIGNQVQSVDFNVQSAIQHAVEVLGVGHIVVCGEYRCGAIAKAMHQSNYEMPLQGWLQGIRDVHRLHHRELESLPAGEPRHRRLVEINVVEQCLNVYKTAAVQKRRAETRAHPAGPSPVIHGVVFDSATGELHPVQTSAGIGWFKLLEMYELYPFEPSDREAAIRVKHHQPAESETVKLKPKHAKEEAGGANPTRKKAASDGK